MKKYIGHILLTLLACACFIFVYYTASRGVLFFADSQLAELSSEMKSSLLAVADDAKEIRRRLTALAEDDTITHTLAQFELGESLEKGALTIRRLANSIAGCESLRLIGIDDQIVIDSARDSLEGKPLADDEKQRMRSLLRNPDSFEFFADGRSETVVRCLSKAGHHIGILRAVFAPSFLLSRFREKAGYVASVVDGVVFIADQGRLPTVGSLATIAADARRTMQTVQTADAVIVPARSGFSSQVFVFLSSRHNQGLPGIAGQILVLNGLLILALILLLLLRVLNNWEHGRLELVREVIDRHDESMSDMQATAEEIIRATDTMYGSEEVDYGSHQPVEEDTFSKNFQQMPDEMPTLAGVLSQSKNTGDEAPQFESRNHDQELQSIIDRVAFQQNNESDGSTEAKEQGEPVSRTLGDDRPDALDLDAWWSTMLPVLQRSLGTNDVILLVDDAAGVFRVGQRTGFSPACDEACTIVQTEKLFTLFAGQQKVLFVKESALKNSNMQRRFPDVDPEVINQLVFVPVLHQNQAKAILVIGRNAEGPPLDQLSLQEVQFLSIL